MARGVNTRESGFILAMLLAIIVAMGILLTAALPVLKTEIERDKEAELIFRGEAMAAGIRAYRAKTGGYPLKLEDMAKLRPPVVRKIYLDPMSKEGDWDLITAVQAGASGDTTGLPIVGVRTKVQENSLRIYNGKTLTSDWAFSAAGNNLLGTTTAATAAALLGGATDTTKAGTGTTSTTTSTTSSGSSTP